MNKKLLLLLLSILSTGFLFSQTSNKLGYIDSDKLIKIMPENDSAQAKLEKFVRDFQKQLETMQVEFNNKYQEYTNNRNTYLEAIRRMKEEELQDMNTRIQQFQSAARENIEITRGEVFKPVIDKAKKAISDVAKENNFTYIFDLSDGFVIYHDENAIDFLPLVKQKLGLK